ncbi:hypothetical protein HanRHA438_Chr09g0377341 [Helianthus annuus]|nr:hypothetical protein HanHA89_Chr09g0320961 [Helianthus annuus]KAJ0886262.1 hypothetical protein HanRHA438_Chr09g0377341 [Helianthus annuus]
MSREHAESDQVRTHRTCLEQENEIQKLTSQLLAEEELKKQLVSKDRDMAGKDAEIVELQRHLRESQEKNKSLKVDLEVERVTAETAEEAHKVSQAGLNVAQENYAQTQSMIEPLVNNSEWLQHYGIAYAANAVLNSIELDQTVAALTIAALQVGHREGYEECAYHVSEVMQTN